MSAGTGAGKQPGAGAGGAGGAGPAVEDAEIRAAVWATVADLGALRTNRQAELVEVAELMGAALYRSPFGDTLLAAEILAATGHPGSPELLDEIFDGRSTLAVAARDHSGDDLPAPAPLVVHGVPGAPDVTVSGTRRFVAFAPDAGHLAVIGTADSKTVLALVPVDRPGVRIRRQDDIGRGDLFTVELDRAAPHGPVHDIGPHYPAALARARIRQAGYLAGAARGALELATAHLKKRQAFGRPLAQHQALAYRLAGLAAEISTVLNFARAAARECDHGEEVRLTAAQALLLAGELVTRTAAESVHLHGAYGMTEACDAQLFYRHAAVDAQWLGTRTGLLKEAAVLLAATRSVR